MTPLYLTLYFGRNEPEGAVSQICTSKETDLRKKTGLYQEAHIFPVSMIYEHCSHCNQTNNSFFLRFNQTVKSLIRLRINDGTNFPIKINNNCFNKYIIILLKSQENPSLHLGHLYLVFIFMVIESSYLRKGILIFLCSTKLHSCP